MVASLPLPVGGGTQSMAVAATDTQPNPDLLNAWSPGLLDGAGDRDPDVALLDRGARRVEPPGHARAEHRRAHRPAQPPCPARGSAPRVPARERGATRVRVVLRPQRLQELQRLLRPHRRGQPARAARQPPARGDRAPRRRVQARRRRVLRADHRTGRGSARAVHAGARGAGRTGRRVQRHLRRRRGRDPPRNAGADARAATRRPAHVPREGEQPRRRRGADNRGAARGARAAPPRPRRALRRRRRRRRAARAHDRPRRGGRGHDHQGRRTFTTSASSAFPTRSSPSRAR